MSFKQHISNIILTVAMGFVVTFIYLGLAIFLFLAICVIFPLMLMVELIDIAKGFKLRIGMKLRDRLSKGGSDETPGTS